MEEEEHGGSADELGSGAGKTVGKHSDGAVFVDAEKYSGREEHLRSTLIRAHLRARLDVVESSEFLFERLAVDGDGTFKEMDKPGTNGNHGLSGNGTAEQRGHGREEEDTAREHNAPRSRIDLWRAFVK